MPLVLPLVPLVIIIGSSISGAGGVAAGTIGGMQISRARTQIRLHADLYEERHTTHLARVHGTNEVLQGLGRTQERAQRDVIFRMRDFLELHHKQVRASEHLILDGVDGSNTHVVGLAKLDTDVAGWVRGVVGSTVAGAATPMALRAGVTQLGAASTGTAISALSGIAAENATLAFLGGGSLAVGGGGMALGATVLNVATVGPGLLVAGLTMKNQGTKARTGAEKHRAEVDIAIAQLSARDQLLRGVRERARELDEILTRLVSEATAAIDCLEAEPLNMDLHGERLQAALILVKAVRDVATAPVADENGNLDEDTQHLIFKYRQTDTEATDA